MRDDIRTGGTPRLAFSKWEGLGNDFIVIDADTWRRAGSALDSPQEARPTEVRRLCDRHTGIGADGVLIIDDSGPVPSLEIWNADGSTAEMCGNGIRCAARWLSERRTSVDPTADPTNVVIATPAGLHRTSVRSGTDWVAVEMRPYSLVPADLPLLATMPWLDEPIDVDGYTLRVSAVSMGNPHLVALDDVGDARLLFGPRLAADPRFPKGVNVGFARIDAGSVYLSVFERGAGWTRACGTGACAAVAAAVELRRLERGVPTRVVLPGGELEVTVRERGSSVLMAGPARRVFTGTLGR